MNWLMRMAFAVLFSFSAMAHASGDWKDTPTDFEDWISLLGGEIPFPPEKLIELTLQRYPKHTASAILSPVGRSRLRHTADFENPLVLFTFVAARLEGAKVSRGELNARLFFNYSSKAKQLEIISWNRNTTQYDFKIVSRYGETDQKLETVDRAKCVVCHQNEGPHFSQRKENPFHEEFMGNSRVEGELDKVKDKFNPFTRWAFEKQRSSGTDRGLGAFVKAANADVFSVQLDSVILKGICGDVIKCRKIVLKSILLTPLGLATMTLSDPDFPEFQKIFEQNWGTTIDKTSKKFKTLDPSWPGRDPFVDLIEGPNDPATRPRSMGHTWYRNYGNWSDLVENLYRGIALSGSEWLYIQSRTADQIERALASPQMLTLLGGTSWPPNPREVLSIVDSVIP